MKEYNSISTQLFGFGISVGGLMGFLSSIILRTELSYFFPYGIAGGILTASLIATAIRKSDRDFSFTDLSLIGIGSGSVIGLGVGLLGAWTVNGNYLLGSIIGSVLGLSGGLLLVLLSNYFSKSNGYS